MIEKTVFLPSLGIDPALFFTGSEEEVDSFLEKEKCRQCELAKIFFAPGFRAAEVVKYNGAREILHYSTRPGVLFQLSYIAPDSIPVMHENYISTGGAGNVGAIHDKNDLLSHFSAYCNRNDLTLRVLYQ